jgi:heme exporter protein B
MRALILRELRLAATGGSALLPLIFFLLVATLFPFAVGPDRPLLARTGGGALWMAALLAALLPVERLVEPDRAGGVLDQLAVRGISEEGIAAAKLIGHWLSFGPPLMLAAVPPPLDEASADVLLRLELGCWWGTPGLAALTLMVSALTAGLGARERWRGC